MNSTNIDVRAAGSERATNRGMTSLSRTNARRRATRAASALGRRSTYRCQAEFLKLGCAVLGCPNRLLRATDVATPAPPAHLVADPILDAPAEVGPQRAGALRLEPVEPCEGVW